MMSVGTFIRWCQQEWSMDGVSGNVPWMVSMGMLHGLVPPGMLHGLVSVGTFIGWCQQECSMDWYHQECSVDWCQQECSMDEHQQECSMDGVSKDADGVSGNVLWMVLAGMLHEWASEGILHGWCHWECSMDGVTQECSFNLNWLWSLGSVSTMPHTHRTAVCVPPTPTHTEGVFLLFTV